MSCSGHRYLWLTIASGVVAVTLAGCATSDAKVGTGAPDTGYSHGYVVRPSALPAGFERAIPAPIASLDGAQDRPVATTADTYRLADGAIITTMVGPSETLEAFVPDHPGELITQTNTEIKIQQDIEQQRTFASLASDGPGRWSKAAIGISATKDEMVSAILGPDRRWQHIAHDDDVSILAGLLPGYQMAYTRSSDSSDISVLTMPAAKFPATLEYLDVHALGSPSSDADGILYSSHGGTGFAIKQLDDVVILVGPSTLSPDIFHDMALNLEPAT